MDNFMCHFDEMMGACAELLSALNNTLPYLWLHSHRKLSTGIPLTFVIDRNRFPFFVKFSESWNFLLASYFSSATPGLFCGTVWGTLHDTARNKTLSFLCCYFFGHFLDKSLKILIFYPWTWCPEWELPRSGCSSDDRILILKLK